MSKQSEEERNAILEENKDYSFADGFFATERIAQLVILGVTIHLCVDKYMNDENDSLLFQSALTSAVAFVVGSLVNYRTRMVNNGAWGDNVHRLSEFLPDFNVIYLLYLPFMLSLLFARRLVLVNSAMAFNSTDIPVHLKLPLQLVFVLINEEYYTDRSTNMKAIAINVALCYILEKISDLKSLDRVDCNLFSILLTNVLYLIDSPTVHFQILQKVLYGFIVAVSVNYALSFPLKYASAYLRSLILFSSFSLIFPLTVTRILTIDGKKPLTWLYEYIFSSETRIKIIFIWLLCLLVLIPNVMIFKSNFSLNTSRKIWHFLILFLLIPPLQLDPEFVKVSLSGTVVLFLVVEYLRYLKLEPVGKFLDEKLRSFSDFRDDRGPIIISYIYLIIGVSAPILINGSLVGVISLGVGDSLASIVGGKWGRIKWPGTNKTVEGTLVFILATSAVSLFCQHRYNSFSPISTGNVILTCIVSGILEGNSVLNDNILIPPFMLIFSEICK